MKDLLKVTDVARHLGMHPQTVRRWVHSGQLQAFKVGNSIKISPEMLEAFKKKMKYPIEYKPLPDVGETNYEESI